MELYSTLNGNIYKCKLKIAASVKWLRKPKHTNVSKVLVVLHWSSDGLLLATNYSFFSHPAANWKQTVLKWSKHSSTKKNYAMKHITLNTSVYICFHGNMLFHLSFVHTCLLLLYEAIDTIWNWKVILRQ